MTALVDLTVHDCDAELRASQDFNPFRCRPEVFECSCGKTWHHVCDEAEGCFYTRDG